MESTADGWTISRTGRYNNNEYASIELQGRALNSLERGGRDQGSAGISQFMLGRGVCTGLFEAPAA